MKADFLVHSFWFWAESNAYAISGSADISYAMSTIYSLYERHELSQHVLQDEKVPSSAHSNRWWMTPFNKLQPSNMWMPHISLTIHMLQLSL